MLLLSFCDVVVSGVDVVVSGGGVDVVVSGGVDFVVLLV